jgi:hypothetical protein
MSTELLAPTSLDPWLACLAAPLVNRGLGKTGKGAPIANGVNGGRDSRGRFAAGNPGGPGNPFARRVAAFRRAVCDAVSDQDLQDLAARLLQEARGGDLAATKVLFAYTIGRPTEAVDPDTLDLQEWRLFHQTPVRAEDLARIIESLPADTACALVRAVLPFLARRWADGIIERLGGKPAGDTAPPKGSKRGARRRGRSAPSANGPNGAAGRAQGERPAPGRQRRAPLANGANGEGRVAASGEARAKAKRDVRASRNRHR